MKTPTWEAIKEVMRWVASAAFGWLVTQTLAQINLVPEVHTVHVWVFSYMIPVRVIFQFCITALSRAADKYVFEKSKTDLDSTRFSTGVPKGIFPW